MIRVVEALRYRSLRYIRQEIGDFQILVGPNASGKSTFLDVIHFLGDILKNGLERAVRSRAPDPVDLVWMREARSFELAVELEITEERKKRAHQTQYSRARYEVAVGMDKRNELAILGENLWLKASEQTTLPFHRESFPSPPPPRSAIVLPEGAQAPSTWRRVVKKGSTGNDYFMSETTRWNNPFRLGRQRLALANLPEDEERFPVAIWLKGILLEGLQFLLLNSEAMRRPAPPGSPAEFQPDGSNLPWAVEDLRRRDETGFGRWLDHVRTALPDIDRIDTIERPEDRHRYLQLTYKTGLKAPSWAVSDGTLRLLALTLVAYLQEPGRIYLIEEPENGIHPQAVEAVFQSLSSAYDGQILCASHSPVILSLAEPSQVLCFARTADGATDIVSGTEHPNLRQWRKEADLGTLFATGVLG